MSREFKRSVVTILLLMPLTLLIPNSGFAGGGEPSCSVIQGPVLPAYFGNVTAQWVSECGNGPYGCVLIYGWLYSAEKGYKDIIIDRRRPNILISGTQLAPVRQVDFLSVFSYDLKFLYNVFQLPDGRCFQLTSANDLSYLTEKLFNVDVVVMELK